MAVLNVTPDSFSDGGRFLQPQAAIARARSMVAAGADILDIGAESTRPGSDGVRPSVQIDRLRDILPAAAGLAATVSVDTTSAEVAAFALDAGAEIINDVSAGLSDPAMLPLAAKRGAAMVLMHMRGEPRTMQLAPHYDDVSAEVKGFLAERLEAAESVGLARDRCIVDPGIGFGKRLEHNLAILAGLDLICELGRPVLVGTSRKRFIGQITGRDGPDQRLAGTLAACLAARRRGATIFRVHDVGPLADAIKVTDAIESASHNT